LKKQERWHCSSSSSPEVWHSGLCKSRPGTGEAISCLKPSGQVNSPFHFVLFRNKMDWMISTYSEKENLLYRATSSNVNLIQNHLYRYVDSSKLTQTNNYDISTLFFNFLCSWLQDSEILSLHKVARNMDFELDWLFHHKLCDFGQIA
jgi:hypothetical protein